MATASYLRDYYQQSIHQFGSLKVLPYIYLQELKVFAWEIVFNKVIYCINKSFSRKDNGFELGDLKHTMESKKLTGKHGN